MSSRSLAGTRPHTLDERVTASASRLTPTERAVADYFVEHREEVAFLSAADLGATLDVSDATVIRTAQSLGYSGLPELKREVRDGMRTPANPWLRYRRSLDQLGHESGELLDHLISAQIELFTAARRTMDADDFRRALVLLAKAKRIAVFGIGPNTPLADYFMLAARRIGRSAFPLTGHGAGIADALMDLRSGDALLMMAYERIVPEITVTLEQAADRDVPCVLVTDTLGMALEGRYAVALVAGRGSTDAMPTVTVPLMVLEALLFGLAGRDRARTHGAIQELNEMRGRLDAGT